MGKRGTVLMIMVITFVALGLTVYGEKVESSSDSGRSVVMVNEPDSYKKINK